MRFISAALALLLVAIASVHSELHVNYPEFQVGRTQVYDVWINMTSGIPGMRPQVAKSALKLEVRVYAKTKERLYMTIPEVQTSYSLPSVKSWTDPVNMQPNAELREHLKIPINVIYEHGKVKSYTLDDQESVESKKIKKTILRHLEVRLNEELLKSTGQRNWPITYNHTKTTPVGNYSSHYIITSSPYPDFPKDRNVINITRTDNLEVIPYLAYDIHHNYEVQGCPGVCREDHVENRFGAGCPAGLEPYQTPLKKSFVQHHNLRKVKDILIADIIKTKETHVADLIDQQMTVTIKSEIRYKHTDKTPLHEPVGQKLYTDLNDWNIEADEEEINSYCKYTKNEDPVTTVQEILNDVTRIIYEGGIEGGAKILGEKVVLLQRALTQLKQKDFDTIQETIVDYEDLSQASEEDKIKRQLWLENLPIVGTPDSIAFIVELIKKNVNKKHGGVINLWECKSLLEALPVNILKPNAKTLKELSELLEALHDRSTPGYGMYYSSAYFAVAGVIRSTCSGDEILDKEKDSRENYLQRLVRETDDDYKNSKCPKREAEKFVKDLSEKLKTETDRIKRIVYIEALSQTGLKSVIPILKPIVEGLVLEATPSYTDYVRSIAINAFHNLVSKYNEKIKDIVFPIYTNKTESPKIRTSAFGIFIKSFPTLGDLQNVAEQSWHEPSLEVGSYVTSTLETVGNSSIPCDQLTARRIKKVMPDVKRFAVGNQHAKYILKTFFDDVRGLGIDHRFEFTPSNESFLPSTMYSTLGYNADSLRDVFFKLSLNAQGFNSLNLWDKLLSFFNIKVAEDIPKSKEHDIFPDIEMAERAKEFWRFDIFAKLFDSMSYYYMDEKEFQNGDIIDFLMQHIKHQFNVERNGTIRGHLVKMWMPSSYQSKTFSQALPYPVQFEMKYPTILSLKLQIDPQETGYSVDVQPSFYHSVLYTNQMLNLGDCKHVGVYHEKKMAGTYPFKFSVAIHQGKYELSYSFPTLPLKIFTYHSEAGTFARNHTLQVYPSPPERRTIKTIPEPFVRNHTFGVVGLPVFASRILTEDIKLGYKQLPDTHYDVAYHLIKEFLNVGWRRKTVEISRQLDSRTWGPKTQVKVNIGHHYEFVERKSREEPHSDEWIEQMSDAEQDERKFESEERTVYDKIKQLSHKRDSLTVTVEHRVSDSVSNKGHIDLVYKRTLEGNLHTIAVNATAQVHGVTFGINKRGGAIFYNKPNEFKYGLDGYGKQKGVIFCSIRFPGSEDPYVVSKIVLDYKSLDHHINQELEKPIAEKYFYPETHEECVRDVHKGSSQTVPCIKALRELAIFNRANARFIWKKELPRAVKQILSAVDLAVKHTYFDHLSIQEKHNTDKRLQIEVTYIDKLTDKPVVDVVVTKPTEIVTLHKVDPAFIQPMSSIYSLRDTYVQFYTNNTYPVTCTLMKDSVRTYDLKSIRLSRREQCSYVLTSHCVRHKKFAVIVKVDPEKPESRLVSIYVGKHSIALKPGTETQYEIEYDNKSHHVTYLRPLMLDQSEKLYAATTRLRASRSSILEVHADRAGIKVTYDGQYVKVQVHPRYKGEVCGLCSEFDGEVVRELRGPNRCLFSHPFDYTASCALGSCYKSKPNHNAICSDEDFKRAEIENQDEIDETGEEYEPKEKRNIVIQRDDKICYSRKSFSTCSKSDVVTKTETEEVEFHCLSKKDKNARKLVLEAKRRRLGEMEAKLTDRKEKIEIPTLCSKH